MAIVVCLVCGNLDGSDHTIHRFPEEVERCNQWAKAIERFDLMDLPPGVCRDNHGLCGVHFSREDFDGDNKLKDNATPLRRQSRPSRRSRPSRWSPSTPGSPSNSQSRPGTDDTAPDGRRAKSGRSPAVAAARVMAVAARAQAIHGEIMALAAVQVASVSPERPGQTERNGSHVTGRVDPGVVRAGAAARALNDAASDEAASADGPRPEAEVAYAAAVCLERRAYARFFPPPPWPPSSPDAAFLAAEEAVRVTRDVFASVSRTDKAA